ncbi:MAG TPA: class I SAM-dependent methyltransferase [Pyrinomonadaceae bacterium]|nr:class I SAM-dependent methyltransferase [Pyrinomonadaceae bacterium]
MNFFGPASAAERYAKGRPFFHPLVVGRAKEVFGLKEPLAHALDVGCGTGLSTAALRELAAEVVGVDASAAMVAHAPRRAGVAYVVAEAERLPFGEGVFDLMTVSQVLHWLDRARFFAEARRVLRADGKLVVYDNYFAGAPEGDEAFTRWHRESYLERYPSPLRVWTQLSDEDATREGFRLLAHELLPHEISFSVEGLADYLLSQSNVIAVVEGGGREEASEARRWIVETTRPLFGGDGERRFLFHAPVWYLRRVA